MPPGAPSGYDARDFPPFAVTVDVAVFTIRDDTLHVLLIRRGQDPFKGALALPGGFVKPDEDLDQAAARELAEETGLRDGAWHLEQLGSYGAPDRDPRMRVVTVAYWAICADLPGLRAGGDAAAAMLAPVEEIELGYVGLAFDHERIVRDAVERTRSKLEYTALAAKFCPPEFTIAQLRRVYEAVWRTHLDPGNFQRNVQQSGAFEKLGASAPSFRSRRGRRAALWSIGGSTFDDDRLAMPLDRGLARRRHAAVFRAPAPSGPPSVESDADSPLAQGGEPCRERERSSTWIRLPYGGPGAGFDAVDLKTYMVERGIDHLVQGHRTCTLAEHPKPSSLDYWLRTKYTERRDTMQAVGAVIEQLAGTGMFRPGRFTCPDSGKSCKGIALCRSAPGELSPP